MRLRAALLVSLLVLLGVPLSVGPMASPAAACSCVGLTPGQAFAAADVVFVGTLVDRTPEEVIPVGGGAYMLGSSTLTFDVAEVAKGRPASRQAIVTGPRGGSCGLELVGPGPHLLFASAEGPDLTGGLCNGSRTLLAGEDPKRVVLGLSRAPSSPDNPKGVDGALLLLVFATGAGVIGFLLILRRERRKRRPGPGRGTRPGGPPAGR